MAIAERLKQLRKNKGIIQQEVATYLNVGRTTYAKYETGDSQPPVDTLASLASFFNVSTDYLLGNTDDPTPPAKKGQKKEAPKGASDHDIMFALFGEVSEEITEDDMEDVRRYAEFIAERKRKEREGK